MKRAEVEVHKLTDAEVERLCCSHDSIKQEAATEDMVHVAIPKGENPPINKMVKNEVPDDELEDITVKEEPIDWHQEPQDQMSAAFALTFKKEVDDACAEARTEQAEAEDELREGSSGACHTRAAHQRSAGASQGRADSLPSDVSGSGNGVEVNPPDTLKSVRFLCAHCDYSSTRKDELELHLRDEHKLGLDYECESSSYSGHHYNKSKQINKHSIGTSLRCELCGYITMNNYCMKMHRANKHNGWKLYKCELCDYSTCRNSELERHQGSRHKLGNLLKCELCDYSTGCSTNLKLHRASKHKLGILLNCERCDYSTPRISVLKLHQAGKHKLGNLLKCERCDYSTYWNSELKRHKDSKHEFGNLLKCELCDYSTCRNSELKRHQAGKHKLGNQLKCEQCDFSTGFSSNLKRHRDRKHKLEGNC